MTRLTVRTMTPVDIPHFSRVATAAGLAASLDYIGAYLRWQPDGYLLGDLDGETVAAVGAQRWGGVSFIGCMCVSPSLQRGGFGGAILTNLLDRLSTPGVTTHLLEATEKGEGLYRKLGFVEEHVTHVLIARDTHFPTTTHTCSPIVPDDLIDIATLDELVFGAQRQPMLNGLPELFGGRGFVLRDAQRNLRGFIMASRTRIGPWIAVDGESARELLNAILSLPYDSPPVIYISEENRPALAMVAGHHFSLVRKMKRMRLGPALSHQPQAIFALASAGLG